ncbi:MAG: iron ABC transporter permease [Gammaproteobacteria bacterium]|nr:iron ABC transporter permease [Gammaproteobacteria bacterium]
MSRYWMLGIFIPALLAIAPILGVLSQIDYDSMKEVITDFAPVIITYIQHTFVVVALTLILSGLLGYSLAFVISLLDIKWRKLWSIAVLLPFSVPAYIYGIITIEVWDSAGIFQNFLRNHGIPVKISIANPLSVAMVLAIANYGYVYLLTLTFMGKEFRNAITLSRVMGYNLWYIYFRIAPNLVRPALGSSLILCMMEVLGDYGTVKIFSLSTLSVGVFELWYGFQSFGKASIVALLLLLITLVMQYYAQKIHEHIPYSGDIKNQRLITLSKWANFSWQVVLGVWFCVSFIFPMSVLFYWTLSAPINQTIWWEYSKALFNSFWLGCLAGLMTLVASLIICAPKRFMKHDHPMVLKCYQWASYGIRIAYSLPGSVLAIGVVIMMVHMGNFSEFAPAIGIAGLLLAYYSRFAAASLGAVEGGYRKISDDMDCVARSLQQKPFSIFTGIHIALLKPSLLAGFLLVFVEVLKELPATLTLKPYDFDTLATKIWFYAHDERIFNMGLPSLMIIAVGLIPIYYSVKVMRNDH